MVEYLTSFICGTFGYWCPLGQQELVPEKFIIRTPVVSVTIDQTSPLAETISGIAVLIVLASLAVWLGKKMPLLFQKRDANGEPPGMEKKQ
jgi:hypothetical protein